MNIINLNNVSKIVFVKKRKTSDYEWVETTENFSEWFKNLFRKNKIKKRYIKHWFNHRYYTAEEFLEKVEHYSISKTSGIIYEKPHVVLWYTDYNHGEETRYFESDKEAEECFKKLVTFAKENNVPFINFYAEN